MSTVTLVSLTFAHLMPPRGTEAIRTAKKLYVQSELHPFASVVKAMGVSYETMDDLYESSTDFDALQRAISARLWSAGDCVYALCGAADAFLPVLKASKRDTDTLNTVPSVSLAQAAFPDSLSFTRATANALPGAPDMTRDFIIEEIDSPLRAGECKLALSEFYPDETEVTLATPDKSGAFQYKTVKLYELDRQKYYCAVSTLLVPAVPYEKKERYGMEDLLRTVEILRAPGGCPWDRRQTHASIKQALIEEGYEAADAIERDDIDAMEEELGDVLLQVGMHAVMGEECGEFSFRDVSTRVVQKLIYRHPHVFNRQNIAEGASVTWDSLKMTEKNQTTQTEVLESVPKNFPALLRARKVQKRAAVAGVDWSDIATPIEDISGKLAALKTAVEQKSDAGTDEALGMLLFTLVSVAGLLNREPEELLNKTTDAFIRRFERMESMSKADGKDLKSLSPDERKSLWDSVRGKTEIE